MSRMEPDNRITRAIDKTAHLLLFLYILPIYLLLTGVFRETHKEAMHPKSEMTRVLTGMASGMFWLLVSVYLVSHFYRP